MRILLRPGVRLSVWEQQNPDAVKVTTAFCTPYEPVRRVLSMRGWMLLLVRYDWRDKDAAQPGPLPRGCAARQVHVTITNPDEFTANRAALSLVDWIRAEFPGLGVTTDAREWEGDR